MFSVTCCFNSIKVRLIHRNSYYLYSQYQFQFHKGSINTIEPSWNCDSLPMFQFHKGSINTSKLLTNSLPLWSFNSIKVRLIRIKGDEEARSLLFQFHKGSINTKSQREWTKPKSCFNSIKVRLILWFFRSCCSC